MTKHALLSASSSARWLLCPKSVALSQLFEETTSIFAEEGTLAHAVAEMILNKYFDYDYEDIIHNKEMQYYVEQYSDFVIEQYNELRKEHTTYALIEQRVDFSDIVPGGFGTCDCVLFNKDTLHIIDLKYGKGVAVDAQHNSQLRLYGYGAYRFVSMLDDGIKHIYMHIVQPRLNSISSEYLEVEQLLKWAEEEVKPKAELAYQNKGGFNPCEKACRFCPARALCKARKDKNMEAIQLLGTRPELIDEEDLIEILENADTIIKWLKEVQGFAESRILSGETVKGFKLVAGRSIRSFSDVDEAFKVLMENGVPEAILYERKPLTLAKIESEIGKKAFKEWVGDYVVTPEGKPTLVKESDKRPALIFNRPQDDFSEDIASVSLEDIL